MKRGILLALLVFTAFAFVACDEATTTEAPTTTAQPITTASPTTAVSGDVTTLAPATTVSGDTTTVAPTTGPTTEVTTEYVNLNQPLAAEFENVVEGKHVYLTTIGQTADMDTVFNIISMVYGTEFAELAAEVTMDNMLTAAEVPAGSIVIIVPGASSKGMGAAGTNQTLEQARAIAFSTRAAAEEITVFVVHTGGSQRRGVESDPLITASSTAASLLMVIDTANYDNFFDNLADTYDVPVYYYSAAVSLVPPFRQIFDKVE
jgi:hypothetical protein